MTSKSSLLPYIKDTNLAQSKQLRNKISEANVSSCKIFHYSLERQGDTETGRKREGYNLLLHSQMLETAMAWAGLGGSQEPETQCRYPAQMVETRVLEQSPACSYGAHYQEAEIRTTQET